MIQFSSSISIFSVINANVQNKLHRKINENKVTKSALPDDGVQSLEDRIIAILQIMSKMLAHQVLFQAAGRIYDVTLSMLDELGLWLPSVIAAMVKNFQSLLLWLLVNIELNQIASKSQRVAVSIQLKTDRLSGRSLVLGSALLLSSHPVESEQCQWKHSGFLCNSVC